MDENPLREKIIEAFDTMSPQLQSAARYVLDHASDIALLSMREQARQANLQPATMTRLAQHLGFKGYEDIRAIYVDALRNGDLSFSSKAHGQVAVQKLKGDKALTTDIVESIGKQIAALSISEALLRFEAVASRLVEAKGIYCLGMRASHAVAWHLHYTNSLCGIRSTFLEGIGGTGFDPLATISSHDVLLAVSVLPYTRATLEIAQYASRKGAGVVAITDSEVSPLAQIADEYILASTASPSFLHAMSPAFVAAEILGALVAGRKGDAALEALRQTDQHLAALNVHFQSRNPQSKA